MDRNLQNSRPFNIHCICSHSGATNFIDQVAEKYFPKDKSKVLKKTLSILLLDLYSTWAEDPSSCLALYMSQRFYKAKSRYNSLGISHKIIDVIVEGVSMAITHRDEFAAIISRRGGKIEGLLAALRKKTGRN